MRTITILFKLTFIFCFSFCLFSCNKTNTPKMVTVPIKAEALGKYKYAGADTLPDARCTGELSAWRAIVEVKGSGTPMGNFTAYFDFCGDDESHYGNGKAFLVTENNDTLFFNVSGQVLPGRLEGQPMHATSHWKDTIRITGGTGIYEGAEGNIVSNDFNSSEDNNSHHNWTGTLTMKKN